MHLTNKGFEHIDIQAELTRVVLNILKNHLIFQIAIVSPIGFLKILFIPMRNIMVFAEKAGIVAIKGYKYIREIIIINICLSLPLHKVSCRETAMRAFFRLIRDGTPAFGALYESHMLPPQFASLRFSIMPSLLSRARMPLSVRFSVIAISPTGTFFLYRSIKTSS